MFSAPLLIVFTLTKYLPDHILTLESVFHFREQARLHQVVFGKRQIPSSPLF